MRWLARNGAAHIERGAISLAGANHLAWLALGYDGRVLAAVLLDAREEGREKMNALATLATLERTLASEEAPL